MDGFAFSGLATESLRSSARDWQSLSTFCTNVPFFACNTIYLASCFTDAVLSQLKTEREVDLHFNLIEILADEAKKIRFLKELFHYQIRIE
jgi:hypothetical protein